MARRHASEWGNATVVSPVDLAERCWDLYLKRDRAEDQVTPGLPETA